MPPSPKRTTAGALLGPLRPVPDGPVPGRPTLESKLDRCSAGSPAPIVRVQRRRGCRLLQRGGTMNRDQVKGAAREVSGKVERKVGEATGDVGQQVTGA